jgi:hypothetical protein
MGFSVAKGNAYAQELLDSALPAEQPQHLVTKQELFKVLWPNTAVADAALTRCIREICEALTDDSRHPRATAWVSLRLVSSRRARANPRTKTASHQGSLRFRDKNQERQAPAIPRKAVPATRTSPGPASTIGALAAPFAPAHTDQRS